VKITAHITAVEDCGDTIKITSQGCGITERDGTYLRPIVFSVAANNSNRNSARIGREFEIELRWK
jgi:hypothetical protein